MLAAFYLLTGLAAVVAGAGGLLGLWWALVALGVGLIALGVLEARGAPAVAVGEEGDRSGSPRSPRMRSFSRAGERGTE